jgi:hypothetical protein
MVNRRSFVAGSAALAALTAVPLVRAGAERPLRAAMPARAASLVIVDRALPHAAAFAADVGAADHVARFFDGDVGMLWMSEIEPRLRAGPVAIAGLTGAATLFCIDLLARDYGAHVVQRNAAAPDAVSWMIATHAERRAALAPQRS